MKLCMGCMNQIEDGQITCPICGYNEKELVQETYYLAPGTVIGNKYIAGRVLEYGGYSVTYLGYDGEKNQKVTIREYLPSDFSTRAKDELDVTIYSGDAYEQFTEGLTTFLNEGNSVEKIPDIQGIAKVYDCFSENETGYIIGEYLEGETLKEIFDTGKKYDVSEAKEIIISILQGLKELHASGVIHYDICPDNVVITTAGETKLINFGATKYSTTSNSKSLAIILKPGYAPEEQYRSQGEKGPWSDVYATAALMYRMITGVVPEESVERAMMDALKTPSELGVKISKSMENALLNALNVYQEYRTQTADKFIEELQSDNVKRIVEKGNKLDTGKFPLWAKGLVAGLMCIIIVGSIFIVRNQRTGDITSQTITMIDTSDMTADSAKESIEKLGAKCKVVYIPDEEDKEGTIWVQSVESGKAISEDTTVVINASGGTNKLTIPSDWVGKKKYDEIEKLFKQYGITYQEEEDTSQKKGFHLISKLLVDDKEVTEDEIEKGFTFDKSVNKSIKICYYTADDSNYEFIIPDFVGKSIKEVGNIKSKTGEITLNDLQNIGFNSIPVYGKEIEKGTVVDQSQKGTLSINAKQPLEVKYCGEQLTYKQGDLPQTLKNKLKNLKINVVIAEEYSSVAKGGITRVVYPNGKKYAQEGERVTIYVSKGTEPKPVSQPQTQPQTTQKPSENKQPNNQQKEPNKDQEKSGGPEI